MKEGREESESWKREERWEGRERERKEKENGTGKREEMKTYNK